MERYIIVTEHTHNLIEGQAIGLFKDTSERLDDGRYKMPLDEEVYDELVRLMEVTGLTIDEFIAAAVGNAKFWERIN